ncbi:MAG: histidine--tRNA ligase [Pseudomonadota bacterium]
MYKSLKGMPDLLPGDSERWQGMEDLLRKILSSFGYSEIRTPYLEETELFARSIGAATDVVEKEMFTFQDQGGSSITLRPENTAGVVRAYLENNLGHGNPLTKLYYIGPMFRHERPQKGRFRQFSQMGVEAIGSAHPMVDVEVMTLLTNVGEAFGLPGLKLEINSVGDKNCRPAYRKKLKEYLVAHVADLCDNCFRRVDSNPMRVFDCKSETCQGILTSAPKISDHLCGDCRDHFDQVKRGLDTLEVDYSLRLSMVRGLDYYTRTAFELNAQGLGSQNAVGGGGRYDGLIEELGGPSTPGIGFAMGLERLLLSASNFKVPSSSRRFSFIPLDKDSEPIALALSQEFRKKLLTGNRSATVETSFGTTSLKSALRQADRSKADFAVLIGESERMKKIATVKNLAAHSQKEIPFEQLTEHLLKETDGSAF